MDKSGRAIAALRAENSASDEKFVKRFVKRGRTKLPLGRGVPTAGRNVDTAFEVALHDVFQCGHASFGQYAQGIQHIEYGGCVIGPEKVFVALVQPRIEHSMPAPRGDPCKGIAIGNQWVPLDFENQPILFAGLSGIEIKRESDLLDNEPCFGI